MIFETKSRRRIWKVWRDESVSLLSTSFLVLEAFDHQGLTQCAHSIVQFYVCPLSAFTRARPIELFDSAHFIYNDSNDYDDKEDDNPLTPTRLTYYSTHPSLAIRVQPFSI